MPNLPSGDGQNVKDMSLSVVLASDHDAVPVSGTVTVDTTALATSAKQTDGSQKTQVVGPGGQVQPAGDASTRPQFVEISDGTNPLGTLGNPVRTRGSDGTNSTPAADAAARPLFAELSDGTNPVGTSGNPLRVNPTAVVPPATSDAGQNLSLGDTSSHQFASAACTLGVMISAPLTNTAAIYIGRATGVTSGATGKGIELQPGDREFFPAANANEYWAITGTATQNVHAVAI